MSNVAHVLSRVPDGLRDPLIDSYKEIATNYAEGRWGPSELDGGKLCEIVYWIAHGSLTGVYVAKPTKPSNMVDACRALERAPNNTTIVGFKSFKILVPRLLLPLYEIRNNRNVGHVGGDVDPNKMDATAVYMMSSWLMAELVRIFHNVSTDKAQEIVDALVERKYPIIWKKDGIKRVLKPTLSMTDKTLLLLYSEEGWVNEADLFSWTEHSNLSAYRQDIIVRLHKTKMVEFKKDSSEIYLLPPGVIKAEELLKKLDVQIS